jgi:hypothetical protein
MASNLNVAKNPVGDIKVWGGAAQPNVFRLPKLNGRGKKNKRRAGR